MERSGLQLATCGDCVNIGGSGTSSDELVKYSELSNYNCEVDNQSGLTYSDGSCVAYEDIAKVTSSSTNTCDLVLSSWGLLIDYSIDGGESQRLTQNETNVSGAKSVTVNYSEKITVKASKTDSFSYTYPDDTTKSFEFYDDENLYYCYYVQKGDTYVKIGEGEELTIPIDGATYTTYRFKRGSFVNNEYNNTTLEVEVEDKISSGSLSINRKGVPIFAWRYETIPEGTTFEVTVYYDSSYYTSSDYELKAGKYSSANQ